MNYDPNMYNQSKMYVNGVWQNVWRQYAPSMTQGESGIVNNRFNNEIDSITNSILNAQQMRGGVSMSEQEVYQWLVNWLTQTLQRLRSSNGMGYYGSGMPNQGMCMNPGLGFNNGMGIGRPMMGMGMPMGNNMGYGQPYMGQPQIPQPVSGNMTNVPNNVTYQMANAYGIKAPQPPMPKPPEQQQHVTTNMPSAKVTSSIKPYTEPSSKNTFNVSKTALNADATGTCTKFINEDNKSLSFYDITYNKPVKTGFTLLPDLINEVDPTVLKLNYKPYEIVDIGYDTLSTAIFEIKDVIQKALASDKEYSYISILTNSTKTLSNKVRGVGDYVESLVVNLFNKYAYTMFLGNDNLRVSSLNDIYNLESKIKDTNLIDNIEVITKSIVNMLKDITVNDIGSEQMLPIVGDQYINGKTIRELAQEESSLKQLKKEYSVVIREVNHMMLSQLAFNDMVSPTLEGCSVTTNSMNLDDSPIDNDLEFFIKYKQTNGSIAYIIINFKNVAVTYLVVWIDGSVFMRPVGLF